MYKYINNPDSNKPVSIFSKMGQTILQRYITFLKNKNTMQFGNGSKINLVYMAKPGYGGWVSFTAHMALKYNANLLKIGNTSEKKSRPYGYGVEYTNTVVDEVVKMPNLLITAIDKNYYQHLDKFPDGTVIVIHDPTEVKGKSCQPVIDNLPRFKVVTIRKTVQKFLREKYNIDSEFLVHPFHEYEKTNKLKTRAVSTSRIDYDKHTELILEANEKLKKKGLKTVDIYGAKNDLYVYRKLREMGLDSMDEKDPKSSYKGRFDKSFEAIDNILSDAKYVVDMSAIKNDGGGSQYTFLEAIYQDNALILSDKWIHGTNSVFTGGYNCLVVSDAKQLYDILSKNNRSTKKIVKNAKKLLKPHLEVDWTKLFN